ncbi:hypothetical protein BDB01DRAFT_39884 [Pilobolus umbonatus]|nr:hypothetical protein BDB01DRAFT_39884 [Pilobolus umbonatus]
MPPNVVGYFRHRKQADGSLTAADIQFMKMFSERVVHSCMCIISSSMNDVCDTSTHNHQYVFWDMRHHHKGMLTMKIANVTESTLNYQRFLSSSPFVIPSTSGDNAYSVLSDTMFTQYENLFKESMLILENSLNKVNVNEQRLVTLRKEIEQLESTQQ